MEESTKEFFKGKKLIVSAGPVWVPVDKVRVMTNIFGGALGYHIAKLAADYGASVDFVYGPGRVVFDGKEKFNTIKFKYYDEIYGILKDKLGTGGYDIIVHSAAIPDYVPKRFRNTKIKSGKDDLTISFKKTKKIIDDFKKWDPNIFVVKFKLETDVSVAKLKNISYRSMLASDADMIVANELSGVGGSHKVYIINRSNKATLAIGKEVIAKRLLEAVRTNF